MIKYLEITTSIVTNLYILFYILYILYFFFFFFIIDFDLYILIPVIIAQMFVPAAELVIPTRTQTNEANAEIETQPVTVEARISKCST